MRRGMDVQELHGNMLKAVRQFPQRPFVTLSPDAKLTDVIF